LVKDTGGGDEMQRVLGLAVLASTLVVGGSAPAGGQQPALTVKSELKMTPKEAGTRKDPQGVAISGRLRVALPGAVEGPTVLSGRMLVPRGIAFNGHRYPSCSLVTLRKEGTGMGVCPKRSIMGRSRNSIVDFGGPNVVFVNGGSRWLYAYVTLYNPAFVQEPVPIRIKRLRGPKWGYELSFEVPDIIQIVAGVPI
jgi:hypothetical protein